MLDPMHEVPREIQGAHADHDMDPRRAWKQRDEAGLLDVDQQGLQDPLDDAEELQGVHPLAGTRDPAAVSRRDGRVLLPEVRELLPGRDRSPPVLDLAWGSEGSVLKLNPGYRRGTELACCAEIRFRDFLGHIPRYFQ